MGEFLSIENNNLITLGRKNRYQEGAPMNINKNQ